MANYMPASPDDAYEAENSFYLHSHPGRLSKLLAHYELYRKITDLPGAVVEMGVFKGASLVRFATFRQVLENAHGRAIIGFDAFGAFPRAKIEGAADKQFIERFEDAGGQGVAKQDLERILDRKGFANISLVAGDIFHTLPRYLAEHPALRIALLHLDLDVYEPTAFALEALVSHMSPGAIVVIDDYGVVEGATRAAEEACARLGVRISKLSPYSVPAFFTAP